MFPTVKKLLNQIRAEGRWRWVGLILLGIVVSLVEAVGAGLVFALLGMAASPETSLDLPLVGDVRNLFPSLTYAQLIGVVAGAAAAYFLIRAVLVILQAYARARTVHNVGARMSARLFAGYLQMPIAFHLDRNSSHIIRNASQSVSVVVNEGVLSLLQMLGEALIVVVLLAFLVAVEPVATLGAAALMAVAIVVLLRVVQPLLDRLGHRNHFLGKLSLETLQQSLHGVREIRLLGREGFFSRRFAEIENEGARVQYKTAALREVPRMTIETTMITFILLFLIVTVSRTGDASAAIASLGVLAYVGMRIQPSLQKIVGAANSIRYASASIDELDRDSRLLETMLERNAPEQTVSTVPRLSDRIEMRGVSFSYENGDGPAVVDVDLTIQRGESIGICGPTGGGKSTLALLLAGLLEPDDGHVSVDGVDISGDVRSWYAQLGFVSQDLFLMDDSLRRNIALGVPDDEVDEEALARATSLARLDDFIASLPQGLDTVMGERGVRVSGGQRQRVAIARALYRDPSVIILDEGTSALDGLTEAAFIRGIEDLRGDHTLVMVAHRLSTLRRCDRIYLVADGRIVDQGSYNDLLERSSVFQAMSA